MKELKIKLMKLMLGAELIAQPGHGDGGDAPTGQSNRRNSVGGNCLKGQDGDPHGVRTAAFLASAGTGLADLVAEYRNSAPNPTTKRILGMLKD